MSGFKSIPIERLREIIRLDEETGQLFWKAKVSHLSRYREGAECGAVVQASGYRVLAIGNESFQAHRVAFALAHGRWPTLDIDHINRIKTDNRPCNLRELSVQQNSVNRKARPEAGVQRDYRKWRARIRVDGKLLHLGLFKTEDEARAAYRAAREAYHPGIYYAGGEA